MQLAAIFVILIAIVINSTNSYTKLEELNNAAVEVFFAMENEEASGNAVMRNEETAGNEQENEVAGITQTEDTADAGTEGTVLRLEDLDMKFEEENQSAKQEEDGGADGPDDANNAEQESESGNKGGRDEAEDSRKPEEEAGDKGSKDEAEDTGKPEEEAGDKGSKDEAEDTGKPEGEAGDKGSKDEAEETGKPEEEDGDKENSGKQAEEMEQSEQAFARNFAEYYKIEKGDTLYKISIKVYGDTGKVEEICELNKIKDPDNIKYGQKILLP